MNYATVKKILRPYQFQDIKEVQIGQRDIDAWFVKIIFNNQAVTRISASSEEDALSSAAQIEAWRISPPTNSLLHKRIWIAVLTCGLFLAIYLCLAMRGALDFSAS